ncbi:MAG TPA: DMT family transporter [Actinomycetota bacterium]|jgi:drug/metabolite transporter (DMT)-like permease|nr:DMT family transporter [Actinomycetota bacterium]
MNDSRARIVTTARGTKPEAFGPAEWGLLGAIALMWGSSFVFIEIGLQSLRPALVTLARIALGAAALVVFPRARRPVAREDWPRIVVLSVVWMSLPLLLFPIAQQWIDSSLAGMINGAMPLFAAAFYALLLRHPPGRLQVIGLVVGFLGVVVILVPESGDASASLLGAGLVLLATACYGLAANLAVPLQQRYGSLPVILRTQAVALATVLPFGLAAIPGSRLTLPTAASMLALGVLGTGVAFVMMAALVGRAGAARGAVAIYFIPVVATIEGALFLNESVHPLALAGVALVLMGAWLTSRRERDAAKADAGVPTGD